MHAMKFVVGAAAALVVGATSAQTTGSPSWAAGEAWGSETSAQLDSQYEEYGAQGRSYGSDSMDSTSSFQSSQAPQLTIATEAYDGKSLEGSSDRPSGAEGRPFSGSGMPQDNTMPGDTGQPASAVNSSHRLSHFHGG